MEKIAITLFIVISLILPGCSGVDDALTRELTKEKASEMKGKSDGGEDLCEVFGWYGDGICDTFCAQVDPDCVSSDQDCLPVMCMLYDCEHGFKRDENGCEICDCVEPPCEPPVCLFDCEHGFKQDEHGCEICDCVEPPTIPGDCPDPNDPAVSYINEVVGDPGICLIILFGCPSNSELFSNECGCGCIESSNEDRTPVEETCAKNSNDACTSDEDCIAGGCGGELCFNPSVSDGYSTCECTAPQALGCGCVAGQCSWYI